MSTVNYNPLPNYVNNTTISATPSGYVNAPLGFLNMPVAVSSQVPINIANDVTTFGFSYFSNIEYISRRQTKFLLYGGLFSSSSFLLFAFIFIGISKDLYKFSIPFFILSIPLLLTCLYMLYYYGKIKKGQYPRIKCCFPSIDPVLLGVIPPNTPNSLSLYSTLVNNPFYIVTINKPISVLSS
jgi:hypothetical protein